MIHRDFKGQNKRNFSLILKFSEDSVRLTSEEDLKILKKKGGFENVDGIDVNQLT